MLLVESYLRYGYDVVLSGLILTFEENGALASLRAKVEMLGGTYWDFYCHAALEVTMQRSSARNLDVPADLVEKWWHQAHADIEPVPWPVKQLDMQRSLEENFQTMVGLLTRGGWR